MVTIWWMSALIASLACLKLLKLRDAYDFASAAFLALIPGLNTIVAFLGLIVWFWKGVGWLISLLPDPKQ